jgi:hypothetical protein
LDLKTGAVVIGNIHPQYDLHLREITKRLPHLRLIFIYRHPREFVSSWNRRAADPADRSWHPGQRGIFGVLSLFSYLSAFLQAGPDCLIVPYGAFSKDMAGISHRMFGHLGMSDDGLGASQSGIAAAILS